MRDSIPRPHGCKLEWEPSRPLLPFYHVQPVRDFPSKYAIFSILAVCGWWVGGLLLSGFALSFPRIFPGRILIPEPARSSGSDHFVAANLTTIDPTSQAARPGRPFRTSVTNFLTVQSQGRAELPRVRGTGYVWSMG